MVKNSKYLFCSREMNKFIEANEINSIQTLFQISVEELLRMPSFPFQLLNEWTYLRDKFNLLSEN